MSGIGRESVQRTRTSSFRPPPSSPSFGEDAAPSDPPDDLQNGFFETRVRQPTSTHDCLVASSKEGDGTIPFSIPIHKSASGIASLDAYALCSAPTRVSCSPTGWSGTAETTSTPSTLDLVNTPLTASSLILLCEPTTINGGRVPSPADPSCPFIRDTPCRKVKSGPSKEKRGKQLSLNENYKARPLTSLPGTPMFDPNVRRGDC
mmetsp:Transcript_10716/g.20753  ORF Transcript_10716/g.20753 Transcript_10716/m.20753 type:complete len:205 (-) Transcript_10716:105-719(-)